MLTIEYDFAKALNSGVRERIKQEAARVKMGFPDRDSKEGTVIVTDRAGAARKAIRKVKSVILVTTRELKVPKSIFRCTPRSFGLYLKACITVHC